MFASSLKINNKRKNKQYLITHIRTRSMKKDIWKSFDFF